MKTHTLAGSICAVLLVAFSTPSASHGNGSPPSGDRAREHRSTASILFSRLNHPTPQSGINVVLFRVKPKGGTVTPLTPETDYVDYRAGGWSPGGSSLVYERAPQWTVTQSQLVVADRQGGSARPITTGPGLHTQPSWGPDATIAYFTTDSGRWCLGAVRANGTRQRILFCLCPTSSRYPSMFRSTPQWALDGRNVYFEIGDFGPKLKTWHSRVYRVNVYSGAVALLTEQIFGGLNGTDRPGPLVIAPDGKHGIYPADRLELLDLDTGTRTPLSLPGKWPLYSPGGDRIAFVQSTGRIFVMKADGSRLRAVSSPAPNTSYTSVVGWSADGRRLLANKSGSAGERWLDIVDLATGKATTLTEGTAAKGGGAWFHR